MSTFADHPWLRSLLGLLFRDSSADDLGRTDIVQFGPGLNHEWDSVSKELTLSVKGGVEASETSADVTVTGGAGATTVYDYDLSAIIWNGTAIADEQSLIVAVRVEAWRNADASVMGFCDLQAHVEYDAAGSAIANNPAVDQTTSSSWEAGLSVTASIVSDTTLRITATSTTTTVRCAATVSHQGPRSRSVV